MRLRWTVKKIAAAALTLLLLTGCVAKQGPTEPPPSQPETGNKPERYATVAALRDAMIESGYHCPRWVQSDNVTKALQSGSCNDNDVLSIYLDSAAVQSSIEVLKGMDAEVTLAVGENWIVNSPDAEAVSQMIGGTVVTSPANMPLSEAASPSASQASESPSPPAASTSPAPTTATASPVNPRRTVAQASLKVGETAHLANWDVTVLRSEHGEDEISYGWKVNVCYVAPSDLAENGRISVSDKPWSAIVQNLEEGGNPVVAVPIREFERDHAYRPDYLDTTLALGECNLGWIGIVHGNPDLGWIGISYEPSTGERITWLN